MNTTGRDSPHRDSDPLGGTGYTLGLCLGILITFVVIAYASYTCKRVQNEARTIRNNYSRGDDFSVITIQHLGLDEATLSAFPRFTYSDFKADAATSACSICLADYADDDLLRLLPDCAHFFHLKCLDPWLLLHPTCPVCRFSPLPTPLAPAASGPT